MNTFQSTRSHETRQRPYTEGAGICSPAYDRLSRRNLQYPAASGRDFFNTIDNPTLHREIQSTLKGFYGTLKSSDEYLQFVFLTGVTKFAQVSVFSDLNHLTDLTLDPAFCDICGITQEELERDFTGEIAEIAQSKGWNRNAYLNRLRHFYNGYRFSEKPLTLYNLFGILHHFKVGVNFDHDKWTIGEWLVESNDG